MMKIIFGIALILFTTIMPGVYGAASDDSLLPSAPKKVCMRGSASTPCVPDATGMSRELVGVGANGAGYHGEARQYILEPKDCSTYTGCLRYMTVDASLVSIYFKNVEPSVVKRSWLEYGLVQRSYCFKPLSLDEQKIQNILVSDHINPSWELNIFANNCGIRVEAKKNDESISGFRFFVESGRLLYQPDLYLSMTQIRAENVKAFVYNAASGEFAFVGSDGVALHELTWRLERDTVIFSLLDKSYCLAANISHSIEGERRALSADFIKSVLPKLKGHKAPNVLFRADLAEIHVSYQHRKKTISACWFLRCNYKNQGVRLQRGGVNVDNRIVFQVKPEDTYRARVYAGTHYYDVSVVPENSEYTVLVEGFIKRQCLPAVDLILSKSTLGPPKCTYARFCEDALDVVMLSDKGCLTLRCDTTRPSPMTLSFNVDFSLHHNKTLLHYPLPKDFLLGEPKSVAIKAVEGQLGQGLAFANAPNIEVLKHCFTRYYERYNYTEMAAISTMGTIQWEQRCCHKGENRWFLASLKQGGDRRPGKCCSFMFFMQNMRDPAYHFINRFEIRFEGDIIAYVSDMGASRVLGERTTGAMALSSEVKLDEFNAGKTRVVVSVDEKPTFVINLVCYRNCVRGDFLPIGFLGWSLDKYAEDATLSQPLVWRILDVREYIPDQSTEVA